MSKELVLEESEEKMFVEIDKSVQESDTRIEIEHNNIRNKLFNSFQLSAKAVAKVYMSKSQSEESFRNAAQFTTALYKDGLEGLKKVEDLYTVKGSNRRTRDLLNFIKRKRRFIRRDELLSFLQQQHLNETDDELLDKFNNLNSSYNNRKRKHDFDNDNNNKKFNKH